MTEDITTWMLVPKDQNLPQYPPGDLITSPVVGYEPQSGSSIQRLVGATVPSQFSSVATNGKTTYFVT